MTLVSRIALVAGWMAVAIHAGAAPLDTSHWTVTDEATGRKVTEVTDNNLEKPLLHRHPRGEM